MKVWENKIKPHLHPETGTYYPPITSSSLQAQNDSQPDTRKRPSTTSPPSLLPATKTARLQQEKNAVVLDATDTTLKKMDAEIAQHFLGMFVLCIDKAFVLLFEIHNRLSIISYTSRFADKSCE